MTIRKTRKFSLLHKYPLVSFFVLALVLGAGTVLFITQTELPSSLILTSALSASIAGIIMTVVLDGRIGLKLMLSRLVIWRVGIGYWLFVLLFITVAVLLGSLMNPLFNGDPMSYDNMEPAFDVLPMFIGFFFISGLGQELGWTGFLITRLQARFSAFYACIIRAIFVGIWHLPLFIFSTLQPQTLINFQYSGWIAQKGFIVAITATTIMFLFPWSIFSSWIFNNTRGSLLLVSILHSSEIWVAYWFLSTNVSPSNLDNYWGYGSVMILVSIIIIIKTGPKNLSHNSMRIIYQPSSD